jgi:hypothetical protein
MVRRKLGADLAWSEFCVTWPPRRPDVSFARFRCEARPPSRASRSVVYSIVDGVSRSCLRNCLRSISIRLAAARKCSGCQSVTGNSVGSRQHPISSRNFDDCRWGLLNRRSVPARNLPLTDRSAAAKCLQRRNLSNLPRAVNPYGCIYDADTFIPNASSSPPRYPPAVHPPLTVLDVAPSGSPSPKSIMSSPRLRAAAFNSLVMLNTYAGSRVSLLNSSIDPFYGFAAEQGP